jgi:hypothetical protein
MPVKHASQTEESDDPAYDVSANEWNADHEVTSGSATVTAGTTYVDVPHGVEGTPDINKIKPTPQDDLGGRSFWVSDVGPATFRINIPVDLETDHVFGWVIL